MSEEKLQAAEERKVAEEKRKARAAAHKKILTAQFSKIEARKKKIVASLVENAAFMIVTLEDLQASINLDGVVSKYQNGENQWGTKKSPEVEIYNSMIKNHMSIMKQLTDLLPDDAAGKMPVDDGFDSFTNKRG